MKTLERLECTYFYVFYGPNFPSDSKYTRIITTGSLFHLIPFLFKSLVMDIFLSDYMKVKQYILLFKKLERSKISFGGGSMVEWL